jgi:hypothetical protein
VDEGRQRRYARRKLESLRLVQNSGVTEWTCDRSVPRNSACRVARSILPSTVAKSCYSRTQCDKETTYRLKYSYPSARRPRLTTLCAAVWYWASVVAHLQIKASALLDGRRAPDGQEGVVRVVAHCRGYPDSIFQGRSHREEG